MSLERRSDGTWPTPEQTGELIDDDTIIKRAWEDAKELRQARIEGGLGGLIGETSGEPTILVIRIPGPVNIANEPRPDS